MRTYAALWTSEQGWSIIFKDELDRNWSTYLPDSGSESVTLTVVDALNEKETQA